MQDGFAETPFGRIHYLSAGSGNPLILLHSNGCSAYEYEPVLAPLAERHAVHAWDMPGHGDSDPIGRHFSIEDYSDAVIAFMDALGLQRASVLGSSVGGTICVDLGVRYADRMDRLFIVETPTRTAEEWAANWRTVEQNFGVPTQTAEQLAPRVREVTSQLLARWNVDRNKAGAWTMVDVMWAIRGFDTVGSLARVAPKSIAVLGDKGPVFAGRPLFEQHLPGGRVAVMKDCGHFPMLDDPDGFVRVVEEFFATD